MVRLPNIAEINYKTYLFHTNVLKNPIYLVHPKYIQNNYFMIVIWSGAPL